MWLSLQVGDPFCGCPHKKRPTIWPISGSLILRNPHLAPANKLALVPAWAISALFWVLASEGSRVLIICLVPVPTNQVWLQVGKLLYLVEKYVQL